MKNSFSFGSWLTTVQDASRKLALNLSQFLGVLEEEESIIVEHSIAQYEPIVARKEEISRQFSDLYDILFKAAGALLEQCRDKGIEEVQGETLSSMRAMAFKYWAMTSFEVKAFEKSVVDFTLSDYSKVTDQLLALQIVVKPKIERNVILMSKLLESHRESYLFWRDLLSRESSGYNSQGQKKKSHSLSYFVTKA
ncbi:MAG: hypothetical protein WCI18_03825 [Pseudomonadota bacterium]